MDNKQLYNGGSEWQNDYNNLPDLQQTFYRNYDAALGRWIAVDPVAESAESMTVYQYAGNNPIMLNDPLGDLLLPEGSYTPQLAPSLEQSMGDFDRHVDRFNQWAAESEGKYYTGGADAINIYHAGDGTSADPGKGSLAEALNTIYAATGYTVGTNKGLAIFGRKASGNDALIAFVTNDIIKGYLYTGLPVRADWTSDKVIDFDLSYINPMEGITGDAMMLTVGVGATLVKGIKTGSLSFVSIFDGPDKGTHIYLNSDEPYGFDFGAYAVEGMIHYNHDLGGYLTKDTFLGRSQSYGLSLEAGSIVKVISFADGNYHPDYPLALPQPQVSYSGTLEGVNIGLSWQTIITGTATFSESQYVWGHTVNK